MLRPDGLYTEPRAIMTIGNRRVLAEGRDLRRLPRVLGLAFVCLFLPDVSTGQPPSGSEPFERVGFLIGRWQGTSDGQPGKGTLHREYTRALDGRFIRVHNRSEYPAQEKNPKGEIHEDEGFISFDRGRKKLVLRQFHVEGFVNTYVEDGDFDVDETRVYN